MTTKTKAVAVVANDEQMEILRNSFPVEDRATRISLPRLMMLSKDVTEETKDPKTKKKTINVIQAAGTFYIEKPGDEEVEGKDGKKYKPWVKDYFEGEESIEVVIVYKRKQLRFFDEGQGKWISSPIYDSADQIIPLFVDRKEIARGTPKELQAQYPSTTAKGRPSSKLKDETILYVLYEGELYQMNLSQSSKWVFSDYTKNTNPSTVVTRIGSLQQENGSNIYQVMSFEEVRSLNADEAALAIEKVSEIKEAVDSERAFYESKQAEDSEADKTSKDF
jgi:hypothetical protein